MSLNHQNPTMNAVIESPCIRMCCLDDHDVCLGCHRTLTEITQWAQADNDTRQQILNNAKRRQKAQGQNELRFTDPQ